jgi:hypothetical protein
MLLTISIADGSFTFNLVGQQRADDLEMFSLAAPRLLSADYFLSSSSRMAASVGEKS